MQNLVRGLFFAALALAGYLAVDAGWLNVLTDENRLASYLGSHGAAGIVFITVAGALFTGLGAPRQVLAFAMGFALGSINGALLSSLATSIGASGCFFAARWLLRDSLSHRFSHQMRQFDGLFREQPLQKIVMVRLLPVGSNLLTNLVAGSSGIRFVPFLMGSTLGYLPQMAIFALAGSGIGNADRYQLLLSIVLFALASLMGASLYRNHRARALADSVSDHP
ncbi:VTT domain-containing protein [Marinobacter sp. SS13-12]|uniref:TVP38/TMEM64 family protein n=1 Tax=Marinobacter sp. SS13-12 TaxID=3050451 RepID=UPI002557C426|nr:VTT domain-containing protein [Marinobacter sp. SS13-12]MDK8462167.1 VTT domain-containing protein [Marinobacter sp. SS13-12]